MAQEQEGLTSKDLALVKAFAQSFAETSSKDKITPDVIKAIIEAANKPYVDPDAVARDRREREKSRRDFQEAQRVTALQQKNCPHKHKDGQNALNLQHNFPDGQARGICPLCFIYIQPAHWEFMAPDPVTGAERPHTVPEHPLYFMVREKEVMS